jgi:ABC-type nitrate/sulfonate/bicarbonate transport system ATPase subunit
MSERPGSISAEIAVALSRPRDRRDASLATLKADVLNELHAAHAI